VKKVVKPPEKEQWMSKKGGGRKGRRKDLWGEWLV